jgi:hypothetical protein
MIKLELMKKDDEIINDLVTSDIIGATLGALITNKKKGDNALLGAIAGAAILATLNAHKKALKSNVLVLVEENGKIYEIQKDNSKKLVKTIEKSNTFVPSNYRLK